MPKQGKRRDQRKDIAAWDALSGLSAALASMTNVPPMLIPFLEDQALMAKVEESGERPRLNRLLQRLTVDVTKLTAEFRTIQARHAGRRGDSTSAADLMETIQISEAYIDWGTRYDDLVLPSIDEVRELLKNAGASTTTLNITSATDVAEAHQ